MRNATDNLFKALADPTRRTILYQLRKGEVAAGQVASRFPISGPSISRHLAVLKAAGLVVERRQANKILYSLVPGRLAESVGASSPRWAPTRPRWPIGPGGRPRRRKSRRPNRNASS